jgi:hypothetical protein
VNLDPGFLRLLCWLGAAVALVAYFAALAARPSAIRMLNGSGLFFTGVALLATSGLVGAVEAAGRVAANFAVLFLVLAAVLQALAALRNRRSWDGLDRRGGSGLVSRP